jgi:hypothetical protein
MKLPRDLSGPDLAKLLGRPHWQECLRYASVGATVLQKSVGFDPFRVRPIESRSSPFSAAPKLSINCILPILRISHDNHDRTWDRRALNNAGMGGARLR